MESVISEEKIRNIVREELTSVLDDFMIKLRLELIPFVSDQEQKEIEELYGEELLNDSEDDIVSSRTLEI